MLFAAVGVAENEDKALQKVGWCWTATWFKLQQLLRRFVSKIWRAVAKKSIANSVVDRCMDLSILDKTVKTNSSVQFSHDWVIIWGPVKTFVGKLSMGLGAVLCYWRVKQNKQKNSTNHKLIAFICF